MQGGVKAWGILPEIIMAVRFQWGHSNGKGIEFVITVFWIPVNYLPYMNVNFVNM